MQQLPMLCDPSIGYNMDMLKFVHLESPCHMDLLKLVHFPTTWRSWSTIESLSC